MFTAYYQSKYLIFTPSPLSPFPSNTQIEFNWTLYGDSKLLISSRQKNRLYIELSNKSEREGDKERQRVVCFKSTESEEVGSLTSHCDPDSNFSPWRERSWDGRHYGEETGWSWAKKKAGERSREEARVISSGSPRKRGDVQSVVQLINLWQGGFLHSVQWIAALIYMVIFFKTLSTYRNLLFLSVLSLNPSCSHDTCTWTCRVNWSLSWHRWILLSHICKFKIFMINYCHNVCGSSLDLNECSTNVLFYHLWLCSPRCKSVWTSFYSFNASNYWKGRWGRRSILY